MFQYITRESTPVVVISVKSTSPSLFQPFYVLFVFIPSLEYRVHHNTAIFSTYLSDKETRDAIMERHFYLNPSPLPPPAVFRQRSLYKDPAASRCKPTNKTIIPHIFKTTYIILHMDHFANICCFCQVKNLKTSRNTLCNISYAIYHIYCLI